MSNVSLQSHSLPALPYSLPALSLLLSLQHQWTSSGNCILFPWIGEYIIEQIYQLSYDMALMPSLMRAGASLLWTYVFLNGLVSFASSKMIAVPHLNEKLAFVEGCAHFRYSDRQMTNVQEWNEAAHVVLAIIRKCPWYYLFDA